MASRHDYQFKAPQDVVFDLPQERITGDVLRGYGPRRGNLERLLRYWRPIMRKPGGFRRCRVILADHPELYPLNNICAWLHHETTGLWPNEGCHHPGMKNCKGKLKKRNWTNAQFNERLSRAIRAPGRLARSVGQAKPLGKSANLVDEFYSGKGWREPLEEESIVTGGDQEHAIKVLKEFMDAEPEFTKYLRDDNNWEIEGEDEDGMKALATYIATKCCGG
jgi:hypothetical protein